MNKELENLIQKELTGNINSTEKNRLTQLLKGNESAQLQWEKIWESTMLSENIHFDENAGWANLSTRIHLRNKRRRTFYRTLASMAAVLFIAITVSIVWLIKRENPVVAYTSQSYMEVFYLPDGTQVWLNDNSTITLDAFSATERRVTLTGEAYFKVKKDPTRPFTISAGNSLTKVLGTEFRIKAYPGQQKIEIKVESGRVQFSSSVTKEAKILYGNEAGYLTVANNSIHKVAESYQEQPWTHSTTKIPQAKPVSKRTKEVYTHKDFLENTFTVRDNFVKQSVIEGEISNSASFTSYKNIRLKVIYVMKGNEEVTEYFDLPDNIKPGRNQSYKLRVGAWFKHRKIEKIEIVDAHAIQ